MSLNFNPLEHANDSQTAERKVIPVGEYFGTVCAAEMKTPEKPGGIPYLYVQIRIDSEGEYKGEKIDDRFTINHPNGGDIAKMRLSALMRHAGAISTLTDPLDLIRLRVKIKTKLEPQRPNPKGGFYAERAAVHYYMALEDKKAESTKAATGDKITGLEDNIPF